MNLLSGFEVVALLVTLTAVSASLNARVVRLPTTVGVMFIALALSLGLIAFGEVAGGGPGAAANPVKLRADRLLRSINFEDLLLRGMLSFLLFAGSLHINLADLRKQKGAVTALATVGTAAST